MMEMNKNKLKIHRRTPQSNEDHRGALPSQDILF